MENTNEPYIHVEPDVKKLRIFIEFLLPDQRSRTCSYTRFDKIVTLFQGDNRFDTLAIFKDIVGVNKKYITFQRLKDAYTAYKANSKEKSLEFKNFFGYMFLQVIKVI